MMVLAKRGQAVSPVASYLAIEPGVRPSTEGLHDEYGEGSLGLTGIGAGGGGAGEGTIGMGNRIDKYDPQKFFEELLAKAWAECGGGQDVASLSLENTSCEVVDVFQVQTPNKKKATCLQEAAWKFELPSNFLAFERWTWEFKVQ
jgi:hypothetical protein